MKESDLTGAASPELRSFVNSIGDAVIVTDAAGRITLINSVAQNLAGCEETKAIRNPCFETISIVDEETRTSIEDPVKRVLNDGLSLKLDANSLLITNRGDEYPIAGNFSPLRNQVNETIGVIFIFRDQSEDRMSIKALRESENLNRNLVENLPQRVFIKDKNSRYLYCNSNYARDMDLTPEQMTGKDDFAFYSRELAENYRKDDQAVVTTGTMIDVEEKYRTGGEERWVHTIKTPHYDRNGEIAGVFGIFEDITLRKNAEDALKRLNRELRAIIKSNQILLRAEDEQILLKDICNLFCNEAGYRLSWVGYVEKDAEKTIRPIAWAGFDSGYIAEAKLTWSENSERGQGPAGIAVRSGKTVYVQDFTTDPRMSLWSKGALDRGYNSGLALPLKDERGQVFGVLLIYSSEVNAITSAEIELMEILAGDLAYGIITLRTRNEHTRMKEALQQQYSTLHSIINSTEAFIFSVDRLYRYTSFNNGHAAVMKTIYGSDIKIGHSLLDYMTVAEDREIAKRNLDRALAGEQIVEESYSGEELRSKKYFQVSHGPIKNEDGEIIGVAVVAHDFTERKRAEVELQQSTDLLHSIVDAAPTAIIGLDLEGKVHTVWNKAAEKMLGWSAEEAIGEYLPSVPVEKKDEFAKFREWIRSGKSLDGIEVRRKRRDGTPIEYSIYGSPLHDSNGEIIGNVAVLLDLTEHNRVLKALQVSEERYRGLFENSPASLWEEDISAVKDFFDELRKQGITDLDAYLRQHPETLLRCAEMVQVIDVNKATLILHEASNKQELLEGLPKTFLPESYSIFQKALVSFWNGKTEMKVDGVVQTLTGRPVYVSTQFSIIQGHGRSPLKMLVSLTDITERKLAEDSLRNWSQAVEQSPASIVITDIEGNIEYVNPKFTEITGYTSDEAIGKNPRILKSGETPPEEYRQLWESISGGRTWHGVFQNKKKNGEFYWESANISPVFNGDGAITNYIAVKEDITELNRAEKEREIYLRLLENMDLVNKTIQGTNNLEQMLSDVLDLVLSLFDCDRAYLLYPCDPDASSWYVPMERCKPEYPGVKEFGRDIPMDKDVAETFRILLTSNGPVRFGPQTPYPLPEEVSERYGFKSFMSMALFPDGDKPWQFGIHQCSHPRVWTDEELIFLKEIGIRLTDRLSSLIAFRNLQISEKRLAEAQRIAHIGYWMIDYKSDLIMISDEACRIIGLRPDKSPLPIAHWTKWWEEHIHPHDLPKTLKSIKEAVKGGSQFNVDFRLQRPDLDERYIHSEANIQWDENGNPIQIFGMIQDLTDQRQAELALRNSEEKFRAISTSALDAIILKDDDGKVAYWNPAAEKLFQYTHEEAIGKNVHDLLMPAKYRPEYERGIVEFKKSGKGRVVGNLTELTGKRKDGTEFPIEIAVSPFLIAGKYWASSIIRDITERKKADEQMLRSNQRLRLHSEHSPLGFLEWDENFCAMEWNDACERIFGYSRQEAIGRHAKDLVLHPEVHDLVDGIFQSLISQSGGQHSINENITKDGRIITCEWFNTTLVDKYGKVIGVASICRDITERIRADEEKAKLESQLRQAQKMESIGRLAGGVAHDFNNLLTGIIGYAEMMQASLDSKEPLYNDVCQIIEAGQSAAGLTKQLLAFSRKQVIEPRIIDLNKAINRSLKMLERLIGEDIDLVFTPAYNLWKTKVDPAQFDQILFNLSVNSRDAMKSGGRLILETQNTVLDEKYCQDHTGAVPGEYVVFSVSDNGAGMSQETLYNIFEPFFTTKEKGKGTGLGLSTVYGIVKQHGGYIIPYSKPDEGTTFRIYLPKAKEGIENVNGEIKKSVLSGGETILLVEDDDIVRNLATRILEQSGYRVLKAVDGVDAISKTKGFKEKIHLLLTDVIMPNISGKELCDKIIEIRPDIHVIFMSGYTDDAIAHSGVLDEGMHFLSKPFTKEQLLQKVREVFDRDKSG